MKYKPEIYKAKSGYQVSAFFMSALTLCLLLLSACSTPNSPVQAVSTPAPIVTSAITPTMKNEADMQLQTFQQWITLMKQYNGDTTTYQQQYNTEQQTLQDARTTQTFNAALTKLQAQIAAIKIPAMKVEDLNLQQKLQQEVASWGQQHTYHDSYNNTTYPLGFEYGSNGIGGWAQDDLNTAKTMADYQQAIENMNMYLTNFQAMQTDSSDKTPYNQPHQTDLKLMQTYGKMKDKVVVVSLAEEVMRVYDNGKLVNSFQVTSGRPDRPTPPGTWWVEGKQSPTVFKAGVPQSSPNWYPDTPINFAMQFHSNGYFLHDSWWRIDYGPGTNFPHADASGDSFSSQGSHGCVNLSKDNASWVYGFVQLYTDILIY